MKAPRLSLVQVIALICALSLLSIPLRAVGQALLVPNARPLPGELGFLMGGAYAALASGGEALWYNPAGLASETGSRLTAGGDVLRLRSAGLGGPTSDSAGMGPGSLAYAQALGDRRGFPRFVLGLSLAQRIDQRLDTRIQVARQGTAASLPPGFTPAGGSIDANFPQGLTAADVGDASGTLRVLAPGVALAIAPADWVRLGLGLELERVSLTESLAMSTHYSASDGAGKTLDGQTQRAWLLAGESLRWSGLLGMQLELTPHWLLGISLRLPSQQVRGAGRVHYLRSDALTQDSGGSSASAGDAVVALHDALPFRLDAPQRVQMGLAYRSDRFLIEVDAIRTSALPSYEALPASESQPPSTISLALPAVRSGATAVLGTAVGLAYAQTERTSLLLAYARDPAPVAPDDGLFRSVDVQTTSAGAYHVRGDLSVAIGVVYREARQSGVRVVPPDGGQPVALDLSLREFTVQMGVSIAF